MNRFILAGLMALGVGTAAAQPVGEVERLQQQLQRMQQEFERQQEAQRQQIEQLKLQLQALEEAQRRRDAGVEAEEPVPAERPLPEPPSGREGGWRPTDPIRLRSGRAFVDVGLVGTFAAGSSTADDIQGGTQLGGHDPNQRGFTVQGVEATFSGAVDPYFRGEINALFALDSGGETFVELEEAYLQSLSLPANLQLKAGLYLTEFGRHNSLHPHSWGFLDSPLVNARLLGPDGLRSPGARLSWLTPTPFYSELFLSVQNSGGEAVSSFRAGDLHGDEEEEELELSFRHSDNDRGMAGADDLLFAPRYALSLDLSRSHVLLAGASAAFGPNSRGGEASGGTTTQLYGLDLTWKWKPVTHSGGFPFVAWQTEGIWRQYDVGGFDWDLDGNGALDAGEVEDLDTNLPAQLPGETLNDYGFYSQLSFGFRRGWVAGLRYGYVTGESGEYERMPLALDGEAMGRDPQRRTRWRLSPNLTYFPSEFSKIRLQYNYDDRKAAGVDHSVWLQFEFVLGAHAAHTF